MKTIIAGSRDLETFKDHYKIFIVSEAVHASGFLPEITEIVSGGARGIDLAGELFAENYNIPVKKFIPDWSIGKHAGILRNREMAEYADALILIWNGTSRGSANMLKQATEKKLKIYQHIIK